MVAEQSAADVAAERIGVRELRSRVAEVVRRAGAGESIVITVDGRPVARLGPLSGGDATVDLDTLIATGMVRAPERSDRPAPPEPVDVPVDASIAQALAGLHGS